jgi:hypothetical protein
MAETPEPLTAIALLRRHVEYACGLKQGVAVRQNAPLYRAFQAVERDVALGEALTAALATVPDDEDAALLIWGGPEVTIDPGNTGGPVIRNAATSALTAALVARAPTPEDDGNG